MFRNSLPVEYVLNTNTPTRHVLAELEPDLQIVVHINGEYMGDFTTTGGGILYFKDRDTGTRKIKLTKR